MLDEYDDDELPAIEVNATIQDSSLEMPPARELASRRARELSVQRALAAPDALLSALTALQVAQPRQPQPRPAAPSLSVALLANIAPHQDTKVLHNKIIQVMKMDSHRLRDPVVHEVCCQLSGPPPGPPAPPWAPPWAALVLWALAAGEGGPPARRALQDCLDTYGDVIDVQSLCDTMRDAVRGVRGADAELHGAVWPRVWAAVRGRRDVADAALRRALADVLQCPDLAVGSGPVPAAALARAAGARLRGAAGPPAGPQPPGAALPPAARLTALALCGRALAAMDHEQSVVSERHRLLAALEGHSGDKQAQAHHECAVSARRLRLLFQRPE